MNREIKFRGWNKEKRKMYGNVHFAYDHLKDIPATTFGEIVTYQDEWDAMQFTGVKDKNGKEIYEGDILNSLYRNDGRTGTYQVLWNDGGACFYGRRHGKHQQISVFVTPSDWTRCEIIGNVWENPELLK